MKNNKAFRVTNICFISQFAAGLFSQSTGVTYGGAEVQLYQLANELAKRDDVEISFLTAAQLQSSVQQINNIKVYQTLLAKRTIPFFSHFRGVWRLWRNLHKINADVYIQRALGPETGLIALYCKIFKKRFVYMIAHEWDVSGKFIKEHRLIGRLALYGMRQANIIIAQNIDQQKTLKENFNLDSTVLPSVYNIPMKPVEFVDRQYVLWVGRAEIWKQPEVYIELAELMPEYHFVMIMPSSNYPKFYAELVERVKNISNLTFIQKVQFNKIDDYFKKALLFTNTSTVEGFPNTFIQAAKNSTPILSLSVNPDNILEKYDFGKVANGSKEVFFSLARELLQHPDQLENLGAKGYVYSKKEHDVTILTDRLLHLLQENS